MKDIALHILDIAQNSVSAGAGMVTVEISEDEGEGLLILIIVDNGRGMDKEAVVNVTDPWYTTRTTRKVGMGIPLLKHSAEQAGGSFRISSVPGVGTSLTATFGMTHPDTPPRGDIPGVISLLAGANPSMEFLYRHARGDSEYLFDTREVKEVLEEIPVSEPSVIRYIREMIRENLGVFEQTRKL